MGLETGIYANLLAPPRSALDYQNDYMKNAAVGQNLLAARLQAREAQQNFADNQALRSALQQAPDLSTPEGQAALFKAAPLGASKVIADYQARQKTAADARKSDAQASSFEADAANKRMAQYRDLLADVNTPQQAQQWQQAAMSDPLTASLFKTVPPQLQSIPTDPQGFQQWKQVHALGMTKYIEANAPKTTTVSAGGQTVLVQTPGLGGAPQQVGAVQHTLSPDTVYAQGQENARSAMADRRARDLAGGAVSYQTDANGNLVALPTRPTGPIKAVPVVGPDGKPMAGKSNLTETQGKATTFAARMQDAEQTVDQLERQGVSGADLRTMAAGSNWTNFLASPQGQQYRQAQENWVTANLRQESGAAISKGEMDKDIRKWFPSIGDSQAVIEQKRRARQIAQQGMLQQAGPGAQAVPRIVGDHGAPSASPGFDMSAIDAELQRRGVK